MVQQFTPLPSPKVPLIQKYDSLAAFVACTSELLPERPTRGPVALPAERPSVVFSVIEPFKAADIYREKGLFDCLSPFNASLSITLAVLPAVGTELLRSNILPTAVISQDDEEDFSPAPEPEPFDFLLVLQHAALNLARDLLSKVVQQFVEIRAKLRVPKWVHDELIKHVPTYAEFMRGPKRTTIQEGLVARRIAARGVAMSKIAYANRTFGLFVADALLVDSARLLFPETSRTRLVFYSSDKSVPNFVSNFKLKLVKHLCAGGLGYGIGVLTPLILPPSLPYFIGFILGDMIAVLAAEGLVGQLGEIK